MGNNKERHDGLVVNLDTAKFEKRGPKGHNKLAPGGAEDGAPNAKSAEATSIAEKMESRTEPAFKGLPDLLLDYAKSLSVVEITAFCKNNGIEVSQTPANGGVMKMRHLNAVKAALKAGKELQK